jgi:hypothetical protein
LPKTTPQLLDSGSNAYGNALGRPRRDHSLAAWYQNCNGMTFERSCSALRAYPNNPAALKAMRAQAK